MWTRNETNDGNIKWRASRRSLKPHPIWFGFQTYKNIISTRNWFGHVEIPDWDSTWLRATSRTKVFVFSCVVVEYGNTFVSFMSSTNHSLNIPMGSTNYCKYWAQFDRPGSEKAWFLQFFIAVGEIFLSISNLFSIIGNTLWGLRAHSRYSKAIWFTKRDPGCTHHLRNKFIIFGGPFSESFLNKFMLVPHGLFFEGFGMLFGTRFLFLHANTLSI